MNRIGLGVFLGALGLSCASTVPKGHQPAPEAAVGLDGTWTNEEMGFPKKTVNLGGRFEYYAKVDDTVAYWWAGAREIVSNWTDDEGNRWYKSFDTATSPGSCTSYNRQYGFVCPPTGAKLQVLQKVSNSGKTLEFVFVLVDEFNANSFPTDINPDVTDLALAANYRVYQRQK